MEKIDASPATGQQLTKELVVQNKMGIHARPAAMIVRITNKFKADVFVEKDDEQVNGKSIMGLMMLAAGKGSKVKFIATGDDGSANACRARSAFRPEIRRSVRFLLRKNLDSEKFLRGRGGGRSQLIVAYPE